MASAYFGQSEDLELARQRTKVIEAFDAMDRRGVKSLTAVVESKGDQALEYVSVDPVRAMTPEGGYPPRLWSALKQSDKWAKVTLVSTPIMLAGLYYAATASDPFLQLYAGFPCVMNLFLVPLLCLMNRPTKRKVHEKVVMAAIARADNRGWPIRNHVILDAALIGKNGLALSNPNEAVYIPLDDIHTVRYHAEEDALVIAYRPKGVNPVGKAFATLFHPAARKIGSDERPGKRIEIGPEEDNLVRALMLAYGEKTADAA